VRLTLASVRVADRCPPPCWCVQLFYKLDKSFKQPRASIHLELRTPLVHRDPVVAEMLVRYTDHALEDWHLYIQIEYCPMMMMMIMMLMMMMMTMLMMMMMMMMMMMTMMMMMMTAGAVHRPRAGHHDVRRHHRGPLLVAQHLRVGTQPPFRRLLAQDPGAPRALCRGREGGVDNEDDEKKKTEEEEDDNGREDR
jgi:hypothetical protein